MGAPVAFMGQEENLQIDTRRSDRIALSIPVQLVGRDLSGEEFQEKGHTVLVSRHGATVLVNRSLAVDQEIAIRALPTNREAMVRVVGQVRVEAEGRVYGMAFLDPNTNLWDIYFPPRDEFDKAAGRALLECGGCHLRHVTLMNELEVQVFESNRSLSRFCERCSQQTLWVETFHDATPERSVEAPKPPLAGKEPPPPPPPPPKRTKDERRHRRLRTRLKACVRHPGLGEEIVNTENVSRGGICFKSRRVYFEGSRIEVSIPYAEGGANIFVPAKIIRTQNIPGEGVSSYGIEYLKGRKPS
jgi:hypothetical protein